MSTNAAFPPYEMTADDGSFEGIDVEIAGAIAEKLGLELQIDDMDFDAALLSVQQDKADMVMAGVTVTDDRLLVMDFTESYATGIQSIIVPEGSDIASIDDLAGSSAPSAAPPAGSTAPMNSAMKTLSPTTTASPPCRRSTTARSTASLSTTPPPRSSWKPTPA